jgi:uncharacterized protein YjdB
MLVLRKLKIIIVIMVLMFFSSSINGIGGKQSLFRSISAFADSIRVEGVSLGQTSLYLQPNQSKQVVATIAPNNASNSSVSWRSDNLNVATINQSGTIVGVHYGTAIIKVKTADGGFEAAVRVRVADKVTAITLNKSAVNLLVGQKEKLIATTTPSSENHEITWISNNPSIAEVDGEGNVLGVGNGSTTVYAQSNDGGVKAKAVVSVTTGIEEVKINSDKFTLHPGETVPIEYVVLPSNATDKTLNWSSSNPDVAFVDSYGRVTALSNGIATITAKSEVGEKSASCEIEVVTTLQAISTNPNYIRMNLLDETKLDVSFYPENASNKKLVYTVENASIAAVGSDGIVTPKSVGSTTIKIEGDEGRLVTVVPITVYLPLTRFSIDEDYLELHLGDDYQLTTHFEPITGANEHITWTSSDSSVADVGEDNTIVAHDSGEAELTGVTEDGAFVSKIHVKVTIPLEYLELSEEEIVVNTKKKNLANMVSFYPDTATNKRVTWESSNPKIATINQEGELVAKKNGVTTIWVKSFDGWFDEKFKVTVMAFTPPTLKGVTNKTIIKGQSFNSRAGITAKDIRNNNLTKNIKIIGSVNTRIAGKYTITYKVTDSYKFTTQKSRIITVKSIAKPVIHGLTTKTIYKGSKINLKKGVTAKDGLGVSLTKKIKISGNVNTSKVGTYSIKYSVTDSYGTTTVQYRKIFVKKKASSSSSGGGSSSGGSTGGSSCPSNYYDGSKLYYYCWNSYTYAHKINVVNAVLDAVRLSGRTPLHSSVWYVGFVTTLINEQTQLSVTDAILLNETRYFQ